MDKENFKDKSLTTIFSISGIYIFEKIINAISLRYDRDIKFGFNMLQNIQRIYKNFELGMEERNQLDEYTKYDLSLCQHAISKLELYLSREEGNLLSERDARIYLSYIEKKHIGFEQTAKETDDKFSKK